MRLKKLRFLFAIILISSLFISGCWGYREIDETAHVLLLGVDKGKENQITLTTLIAVPRFMGGGGGGGAMGGGGGGGGGQKPVITVSAQSRTILTGLNMINSSIERRTTLNHLKVIVFSEEIAKQGIDRYLAQLMRYPEFRRTTFIVISTKDSKKILESFQPIMETNPSKFAELFMATQHYVGFIPFGQVHHFYADMKSKSIQPVAALIGLERKKEKKQKLKKKPEGDFIAGQLPRKGGNKVEVIGSAVFYGPKMVGTINGSETTILNMIRGWFKESYFAFPDPENKDRFIIVRITAERKPQMKVYFDSEGTPVINVQVPLDAGIISIQSGINYERPQRLAILEHELNLELEKRAMELISKSQEEFCSDIFGFGFKARHLVTTYPQWQKMNWQKLYPEARVSITFDTKIRRTGLLRKTVSVKI